MWLIMHVIFCIWLSVASLRYVPNGESTQGPIHDQFNPIPSLYNFMDLCNHSCLFLCPQAINGQQNYS